MGNKRTGFKSQKTIKSWVVYDDIVWIESLHLEKVGVVKWVKRAADLDPEVCILCETELFFWPMLTVRTYMIYAT